MGTGRAPIAAIIAVMLVLAAYFTWLMIQMAQSQHGGIALLIKILLGIAVVVLIPGLIIAVLSAHDRHRAGGSGEQ